MNLMIDKLRIHYLVIGGYNNYFDTMHTYFSVERFGGYIHCYVIGNGEPYADCATNQTRFGS
jgi:hypothetical protein